MWTLALFRRPFFKSTLLFALLHFAVLLCVSGLIFVASHIPPKAVNLDSIILFLAGVEWVLEAPRKFLLWVWPGESTQRWLGFFVSVVNSLVWGCALACLKWLWRRATA